MDPADCNLTISTLSWVRKSNIRELAIFLKYSHSIIWFQINFTNNKFRILQIIKKQLATNQSNSNYENFSQLKTFLR